MAPVDMLYGLIEAPFLYPVQIADYHARAAVHSGIAVDKYRVFLSQQLRQHPNRFRQLVSQTVVIEINNGNATNGHAERGIASLHGRPVDPVTHEVVVGLQIENCGDVRLLEGLDFVGIRRASADV